MFEATRPISTRPRPDAMRPRPRLDTTRPRQRPRPNNLALRPHRPRGLLNILDRHTACARATVALLRQETPNFLASNLWPPNSPDLNPVDYEIWAVIRHRVYHRQSQIYSVDELKPQLIDVSCGLEQSIFDEAIDQWLGRHRACMLKEANEDTSSTACELTVLILSISVTFSVTCLTVTSLITKSCRQR